MGDEKKSSGGFTVSELEQKAKKYGLEIVLSAMFLLSAIFALTWGGTILVWSVFLCMILAVVGVIIPKQIKIVTHSFVEFIKKEKMITLVIAVVGIVLSIFLPFIIFAIVGAMGGKSVARQLCCCSGSCGKEDKH
jgi:hypothetical protein